MFAGSYGGWLNQVFAGCRLFAGYHQMFAVSLVG